MGPGAIIAALALGLVLGYRASGVVNLGHGAIATYVAYTYTGLRSSGDYFLPPIPNPLVITDWVAGAFGYSMAYPSIPASIDLGDPMGTLPATLFALGTAIGIGLALHFLVFRPLRYSPPLAKVAASVGVLLVLASAVVLRFGSRAFPAKRVLPRSTVDLLGATIPVDRFILFGIVVLLTAILWALFRFTHYGRATRAASENERAATLLGVSTDFQAGISWILASLTAGVMGILVAPITGLVPTGFTLIIVPALGAALVGRLMSFSVAAGAGLAIGMLQSSLFYFETEFQWFPDLNLQQALPFIVIVIAMFLRGASLPGRATLISGRLPEAPRRRHNPLAWTIVGVGALLAVTYLPFQYRDGLNNTLIGVILCLSVVVVTGYVGQMSLTQGALAGMAAFGFATFTTEAGLPVVPASVLAVVAAIMVGFLVGIPAIRTRGTSLAIVTLATAVAIEQLLFNREGWFGTRVAKRVDPPSILGFDFGPTSDFIGWDGTLPSPIFGIVLLGVTAVLCFAVAHLRHSELGKQMLAVRANERAAAAAGVNVSAVKLIAFMISAGLAGIAGVMSANKLGTVEADSFNVLSSIMVLVFAYLGGITTVSGAVWGGVLFAKGIGVVITEQFVAIGSYTGYIAGVFLVLTALTTNEGIDGGNRQLGQWLRRKWTTWMANRRVVVPTAATIEDDPDPVMEVQV